MFAPVSCRVTPPSAYNHCTVAENAPSHIGKNVSQRWEKINKLSVTRSRPIVYTNQNFHKELNRDYNFLPILAIRDELLKKNLAFLASVIFVGNE